MSAIAVIGEAVADAIAVPAPGAAGDRDGTAPLHLTVHPGGGPANTAVALARLGSRARFFGRLSSSVLGRLLRGHLEDSRVDLSHAVTDDRPATLAIAALDAHGRAGYDFYTDGTADWAWKPGELDAAGEAAIIHTGSLALVRPPGDEVILEALRRHRSGTTISIDPNVRPAIASPGRYRDGLAAWAGLADVLKLSEDDLALIHPGVPHRELCERWHALGCRLVVITLGERGSVASLDGERIAVPARPIRLADTIGAGDAFTAGLLHHLLAAGFGGGRLDRLDTATLSEALDLAGRVAAATCEVPGADPPWSEQLGLGDREPSGR